MFKDSSPLLTLIGGVAVIYLIFAGSRHAEWWSNTTTIAQVVEDFNSTKNIKARALDVSAEAMPAISEEEVLAFLGRQYDLSGSSSEQRRILETALRTRRLPVCTYIKVSKTDLLDSPSGVQLELCLNQSKTGSLNTIDGNFTIPCEL